MTDTEVYRIYVTMIRQAAKGEKSLDAREVLTELCAIRDHVGGPTAREMTSHLLGCWQAGDADEYALRDAALTEEYLARLAGDMI